MNSLLTRRHILAAGAACGAARLLPGPLAAQAKTLVAATFPGTKPIGNISRPSSPARRVPR